MPELRVTLIDEVRNRHLKVDLPDDAAMEKLLPALAEKLGLPVTDPDGQPIAYRLTHEATGRALGGGQTLASFGVGEGETLRLAAAREEAPVVPWPTEEEAVPFWQKVPVWVWVGIVGVVIVIALAGAFLAGQRVKPEPMPTMVAEVPTLAATEAPTRPAPLPTAMPAPPTSVPTSTPRPTATPVPLTDTPVPTDTPVLPTDTPAPTATPRPTPTPTPTMDADPTVYDNFNNPANEGGYNKSLWEPWGWWGQDGQVAYQVAQQNGMLIVTQESEEEGPCIRLGARKYSDVRLNTPTFFEAKLMLSLDKFDGGVRLRLWTDFPGGGAWQSVCAIKGYYGAFCYDSPWPEQEGHWYDAAVHKPVDLGTWHTLRIEVDPATMTFTYYIDGQMAGSHVPADAEELKKSIFDLVIGVCGGEVTGYIDDVRVGPVQ